MPLNRDNEYVRDIDQPRLAYLPEHIIRRFGLPEKFTFPFHYDPHPLARAAAADLQRYLETELTPDHNFGFENDPKEGAIGKMFGVLVVQDTQGKTGYLSAFSGKLAGSNDHPKFVPPVFDMLVENSFFLKGIEIIDGVNTTLEALASDGEYLRLKAESNRLSAQAAQEIALLKQELKANKEARQNIREAQRSVLSETAFEALDAQLIAQSLYDKRRLKSLTDKWKQSQDLAAAALSGFETRIERLKQERRERSATLQGQLFDQYVFLNKAGKTKSLQAIFSDTVFGRPPSAAGECATPKLLQFAFQHGYMPLAMAEFWWGASPKSEIRKHGQFYPACTGKCKPILAHMLEGMEIDDNPLLKIPEEKRSLEILFEDSSLLVVNKPSGLRSVPGVDILDSVYSRLKCITSNAEPLMVHRLDMDTSGLLVVAKTPEAHRHLQKQFLRRTVSKRYTALLSKRIEETDGEIRLPLRADLLDRPRQLVCFEHGKTSITKWKAIDTEPAGTRVHFWPLTGRTHQLRMHAAHELGLNAPILGDDLYGTPASRLFLHAAELSFAHPQTKAVLHFVAPEEF